MELAVKENKLLSIEVSSMLRSVTIKMVLQRGVARSIEVNDSQQDHTHSGNVASVLGRKSVGEIKSKMSEMNGTSSTPQAAVVATPNNDVLNFSWRCPNGRRWRELFNELDRRRQQLLEEFRCPLFQDFPSER